MNLEMVQKIEGVTLCMDVWLIIETELQESEETNSKEEVEASFCSTMQKLCLPSILVQNWKGSERSKYELEPY